MTDDDRAREGNRRVAVGTLMPKTMKTEHAGAKNDGGYWGPRVDAKRRSRKLRRHEDARTDLDPASPVTDAGGITEAAKVRREFGLE